jgi:hypothetical protein
MVGPAIGFSVPSEEFLKHIAGWRFDPDLVDIQHPVFVHTYSGSLQYPAGIVLPFTLIIKFYQRFWPWITEEKIPDIRKDSIAFSWRFFCDGCRLIIHTRSIQIVSLDVAPE